MRQLETLLEQSGRSLQDATLFAADLGPGSFTGVKVAVTIAKTLAYALGKPAAGTASFDLIDPAGVVVMPSKRGEFFIRQPGEEPVRSHSLPAGPFTGFGPEVESPVYPEAFRFSAVLDRLHPVEPERLVPNYLIEPSISVPKKPYGAPGAHA
jgi:tRNA threonylcarbamoyladenosine biosynthesis protein TsaB